MITSYIKYATKQQDVVLIALIPSPFQEVYSGYFKIRETTDHNKAKIIARDIIRSTVRIALVSAQVFMGKKIAERLNNSYTLWRCLTASDIVFYANMMVSTLVSGVLLSKDPLFEDDKGRVVNPISSALSFCALSPSMNYLIGYVYISTGVNIIANAYFSSSARNLVLGGGLTLVGSVITNLSRMIDFDMCQTNDESDRELIAQHLEPNIQGFSEFWDEWLVSIIGMNQHEGSTDKDSKKS